MKFTLAAARSLLLYNPRMPMLEISLAFLSGIAIQGVLHPPLDVWLILSSLGILLAWAFTKNQSPNKKWWIIASTAALLLGAARYQLTIHPRAPSDVVKFNDRKYEIFAIGTLVEPPDYRDTYTNLRLQVSQFELGKAIYPVQGLLLVRIGANQTYSYGDNLRLKGKLVSVPAAQDFSYDDYLSRAGSVSYMLDPEITLLPGFGGNPILGAIYTLKARSLQELYRLFPDPEASLEAGILLGVDGGLPAPLLQDFKDTGTAHLLAIPGFNIALIAAVLVLLFNRILPPRVGAVAAVLGIAFYTILAGAGGAVVRAASLATVSLLAVQFGNRKSGFSRLALIAALIAIWNPLLLWDAAFQISFFAILGLVMYGNSFQRSAADFMNRLVPPGRAQRVITILADLVLLPLAAQLMTIPIMAFQFKQIPLVTFIASPFILPAQPAVMILGGLAVSLGLVGNGIGQLLAAIAWLPSAFMISLVEGFGSLPHSALYLGSYARAFVVVFYLAVFAVTLGHSKIRKLFSATYERFHYLPAGILVISLLICSLFTWHAVAQAPDGKLHITFLSVGSGDAILIKTPTGRNLLINGGPSTSSLSDALGSRLSPLDNSLDWLIIASTDENQVASLPRVLESYPPKNVLWSGDQLASLSSQNLTLWLMGQSVPILPAKEGRILDLGGGATLKVLSVSATGSTLLIEWQGFRALLPVGENLDTLNQLEYGNVVKPVTLLTLAQSGSAPLSPPDWINNLSPQLVILSVGSGDTNGRPDPQTLDALTGRTLLRTDQNGWIEVMTDGKQLWVRVERQ
jgi:competence protein ComEC